MHEAREVKRSQRKKIFRKSKRKSESFLDFLLRGKPENPFQRKPHPKPPKILHFRPVDPFCDNQSIFGNISRFLPEGKLENCISEKANSEKGLVMRKNVRHFFLIKIPC